MNLTARDLVYTPVPQLLVGPGTTKSDSTHHLEFKATLVHWNTFEEEVRASSVAVKWDRFPYVLAYAPPKEHTGSHHTYWEQWRCGDEISVSGRFEHNVSHYTSSVFRTLNIPAWFGDYKTCTNGTLRKKVPDIVMVNDQGHLRAVGEVKTPWKHDLHSVMMDDQREFRHYLGQISRYMYLSKMKYGFLTTYEQTIFLKQAPKPGKPKEIALWHSNAIHYDQANPSVTLRECFLFLGLCIQAGDYKCDNGMSEQRWIGKPGGVYSDSDYISPDDSPGSSKSHSLSESAARASHGIGESHSSRRVTTRSQSRARHNRELEDPHLRDQLLRARDKARETAERELNEVTGRTRALGFDRENRRQAPSPVPAYMDSSGRPYVRIGGRSSFVTIMQDRRGDYYYKTASGDRQYVEMQ